MISAPNNKLYDENKDGLFLIGPPRKYLPFDAIAVIESTLLSFLEFLKMRFVWLGFFQQV